MLSLNQIVEQAQIWWINISSRPSSTDHKKLRKLSPAETHWRHLNHTSVKGEFTATLRKRTEAHRASFYISDPREDGLSPLLGKSTLLELGMLKIDPEGKVKEINELRMKTVRTLDDSIKKSTERIQPRIPMDRLLSGKEYRQGDWSQARNGNRRKTCGSETTTCTVSPTENAQRLAGPWSEGGDIRESSRWRGDYLVFTSSGSTQTKFHRDEEWRVRVLHD